MMRFVTDNDVNGDNGGVVDMITNKIDDDYSYT